MFKSTEDKYLIWPDYVKVGALNYPPGGTLGPRIQSTIELVMIHQGEMTVYIDSKPFYAPNNTTTIFFPGHEEHYHFSKEMNTFHSYLHLSIPRMPETIKELLYELPKTIPLSKQMAQLTSDLIALKSSSLSTRDMMLKTQSLLLFWLFVGEAESFCKNDTTKLSHDIIEGACRFIEARLNDELTLESIAAAVSVCPEYLIRVFNQELHITPIAYLWQRRVLLGIDLLEHSGLSISMIAERCGFKTRNHFSRRITEATGNSPKIIRRKIWRSLAAD
jgi:AraC-like DNA-binding protein